MRKIIAGMNMTLDGVCDHTEGVADDELHQHYEELLLNSGVILYGRTTFELMKYWQDLAEKPGGDPVMDDFAKAMDSVPKVVFSRTLHDTAWHSATLATRSLKEEAIALREQPGKDILVGSRSLIVQLLNLGLVDEFQLSVHPIIAGKGLALFDQISDKVMLKLSKTKTFGSGVVTFFYEILEKKDGR
ncbi:hypothetical protein GCM10010967_15670 [Dyadobacter beijingensis]|uniref:Bacterial bifunctional deaminase-reductase C-terminal domain-containing protein n=1 Tax=Dyadobacter beijingensis TaxID=365489 RepID=A0ABQ2HKL5_9BACT|nr:dihydrofolate reductase family protein [Dyadobacter beijingensis]GGM84617.1 hypothetical protein GCM10010967_15670 [Dyadobacter beijingensis]